jgi:hypothetical protein
MVHTTDVSEELPKSLFYVAVTKQEKGKLNCMLVQVSYTN